MYIHIKIPILIFYNTLLQQLRLYYYVSAEALLYPTAPQYSCVNNYR